MYLRINRHVGEYPWLDKVMLYSAHWLVYILIVLFVLWLLFDQGKSSGLTLRHTLVETFLSYFFAYLVSYAIAVLWRHERPIKEFPNAKQLFHTWGTWKSFPSDHSIASSVPFFLSLLLSAPITLSIVLGFGFVLVAIARVYAGVHYPRDIVGGFLVAGMATLIVHYIIFS